VKTRMMGLQSE